MEKEQIEEVNRYWNARIEYDDYPGPNRSLEEAMRLGGKCHDYVEAKGAGLIGAGIPADDLLVGIGATLDSGEAHSVLICDGWVLDNRRDDLYQVADAAAVGQVHITDQLPYPLFFGDRRR